MAEDSSSGVGSKTVPPGGEPGGLEGAHARGVAAREAWVRDGLLVSPETAAQRWGISGEDVAAMVARGELFELEVGGRLWMPAVFLELPRSVVADVNKALAEAGADAASAFVFWHRTHGALSGRSVVDRLHQGAGLGLITELARTFPR